MPRLSDEELASRRFGLGSTDIVEANGLAPWKGAGPMRLFCEKTGILSPDDEDEEDRDDDWLEWGHLQEPVIAQWYEDKRGTPLMMGGRVEHSQWPHLWATLDRKVIGESRLVEIKNVGSPAMYRHWDTSSPEGIPDYVRAQVQVAMCFAGCLETDVVASIGGRPPHVWRVFQDSELSELLIAGALKFWQLVKDGTPPPLDATPASRVYLRAKYPRDERPMIEADEAAENIAGQRIDFGKDAKDAARHLAQADTLLMNACGDARGITGNGWKFTWKIDKNCVRRSRFTGMGVEE